MRTNKTLSVCEMFYSLQGEGATMGIPAVFLRLAGCNLMCGGKGTEHDRQLHNGATWRCDTIEVWMNGSSKTYSDILDQMNVKGYLTALRRGAHLVITGGEPLLQQESLFLFLHELFRRQQEYTFVEIETNGTIIPSGKLEQHVSQWNISPKLSTSGAGEKRIHVEAMRKFAQYPNAKFKFVVSNNEDLKEVEVMIKFYTLRRERIWLMPAASTRKELNAASRFVAKYCIKNNYNFSSRLQVQIWDETVGV